MFNLIYANFVICVELFPTVNAKSVLSIVWQNYVAQL